MMSAYLTMSSMFHTEYILTKRNILQDARGIRKFIKETLHASAGKTTHGLIGSAEIPLRSG